MPQKQASLALYVLTVVLLAVMPRGGHGASLGEIDPDFSVDRH